MSELAFDRFCANCLRPFESGFVLSCADFLCDGCATGGAFNQSSKCPLCNTVVNAVQLTEPPAEVADMIANPAAEIEKLFNSLKFQISHYKKMLKISMNLINRLQSEKQILLRNELKYKERLHNNNVNPPPRLPQTPTRQSQSQYEDQHAQPQQSPRFPQTPTRQSQSQYEDQHAQPQQSPHFPQTPTRQSQHTQPQHTQLQQQVTSGSGLLWRGGDSEDTMSSFRRPNSSSSTNMPPRSPHNSSNNSRMLTSNSDSRLPSPSRPRSSTSAHFSSSSVSSSSPVYRQPSPSLTVDNLKRKVAPSSESGSSGTRRNADESNRNFNDGGSPSSIIRNKTPTKRPNTTGSGSGGGGASARLRSPYLPYIRTPGRVVKLSQSDLL